MRKRDERDIPNSCWNKADDDEIVFVLRSKDEAAPGTILEWVEERIALGLNTRGSDKLLLAIRCANEMTEQRAERKEHPRAVGFDCPHPATEKTPEPAAVAGQWVIPLGGRVARDPITDPMPGDVWEKHDTGKKLYVYLRSPTQVWFSVVPSGLKGDAGGMLLERFARLVGGWQLWRTGP